MRVKLIVGSWLYLISMVTACGQDKIAYRLSITVGPNAGLIKNSFGLKNIMWQYNVGLSLEQRFSPAFSVAYGLIYSRQGETVKDDYYSLAAGQTIKNKQEYNFNYLTLPIMIRVRPKRERAFIEAGGQIGYMVYNHFRYTNPPSAFPSGEFPHSQPWDAGLIGGIGYRLGKHFVVDGRYYYGMKSITADFVDVDKLTGATAFIHIQKWFNRVYSVNLNYYF